MVHEEDDGLGVCSWQTSRDAQDQPDAQLFIEYALTVSDELWEARSMAVVDEEDRSPDGEIE